MMCNVDFNGGCSGIDHSLCLTLTVSFLRQRVLDQSGQAGYSLTFTLPAEFQCKMIYTVILFLYFVTQCYAIMQQFGALFLTLFL